MNTRFQQGNSAIQSPGIQRPEQEKPVSSRGIAGLVLAFLLPPIGLLFLWRKGVFRTRGRMLITIISTLEMMALCILLTPKAELAAQIPTPSVPQRVTAAPESEALDALYNIEQLLYEQQLAEVIEQGGSKEDLMTEEQLEAQREAEKQEVLNTIVYCVYNDAISYHANKICGTQTNGRELTVEEAMREGLGACKTCNPPVWID